MKIMGHLMANGTLVATLMGLLPGIAALFTIGWYIVCFYDRFVNKNEDKEKD